MDELFSSFGWCLVGLAAIFALGLAPRLARHFYPEAPSFHRRLAAACFAGVGFEALVLTAVVGSVIAARWRWKKQRRGAEIA